ncbi:hypothetical protein [Sporanaerobium hydrogeniformans]|uniref:hypothetical protein n=1 Tax=Sporanaerobium hydrogeniformans TaxID=3072179 RepID=UPI0015D4F969|nr:hypothetical protein [Sporanaerobium hydrogeniformans]
MDELQKLTIKRSENSTIIKLDGFELKNIVEYELKSSANGPTELLIKVIVVTNEIEMK